MDLAHFGLFLIFLECLFKRVLSDTNYGKGEQMARKRKESGPPSVRVNVYIPKGTHELMRDLGGVLGFRTDAHCLRHFLTLGIQASAGSISAVRSVDQQKHQMSAMTDLFERTMKSGFEGVAEHALKHRKPGK